MTSIVINNNIKQKGFVTVNHNEKVYLAGGIVQEDRYKEAVPTNNFYVLEKNHQTWKWTKLAPMLEKRSFFGLISYGGHIYAFGGKNTSGNFEKYNEDLNVWEAVIIHSEYSKIIRYAFGYSIIGKTLFISGGILYEHDNIFIFSSGSSNNKSLIEESKSPFYDNYAHSSLVEAVDLQTFSIKYHSRLNIPRGYHEMKNMTVFGGQVLDYDFDSSSDEEQGYITSTQTIEKYNNSTNKWMISKKIVPK
jgi:hypothetical protein